MKIDGFKQFISLLERENELIRISVPVASELEITELADRQMKSPNGGKALLVERPTVNGKPSRFPVLINAFGSWNRMAIALGTPSINDLIQEIASLTNTPVVANLRDLNKIVTALFNLRHIQPRVVPTGPCKEVIHKFDPPVPRMEPWPPAPTFNELTQSSNHWPTILDLPILKCWPLDGGRFITLPCVITKHPETGQRNVGMYRMQVFDPTTTGMHWHPHKTGAKHFNLFKQRNLKMPVAVFLGGDPVYTFVAAAPFPDGIDELQIAGFLRKRAVELVKCETVDLEVPADADIVLEGFVDPNEPLREEGPFGDHTGFYSVPELYPVFHITAVTYRKDAVYPATVVGIPPMEDWFFGATAARLFLPMIKLLLPEVVDIALPSEGVFHNFLFVSIKKQFPMHAYKVMYALWGLGQMCLTKYIVVVDEDVNVHDTREVLFWIGANTDPARDCIITRGPADVLDHATTTPGVGSKLGIDATKKLPGEGITRPWPPVVRMSPEIKIRIDQLLRDLGLK